MLRNLKRNTKGSKRFALYIVYLVGNRREEKHIEGDLRLQLTTAYFWFRVS